MKIGTYEEDGTKIYYEVHDFDDIIEGIDDLPKDTVKTICKEFFKQVCLDMIKETNTYVFPEINFALMYITDINDPEIVYDINNWGHNYIPILAANRKKLRNGRQVYKVQFQGEMEKVFQNEIKNNHYY